jgi:hypothetical protein
MGMLAVENIARFLAGDPLPNAVGDSSFLA